MTQTLIVMLVCVLLEGFFSGSEIALVHANRLALAAKAEKGMLGARIALRYLDRPDLLLGTTLVGTNLATVTGTMTATLFMLTHFGQNGELLAIMVFWPMTLILGEIVPKSLYQSNADRIAPLCGYGLQFFSVLLYPAVWLSTRFSSTLIRLLKEKGEQEHSVTRADVKALTASPEQDSDIQLDEKRMIGRMIDFSTAKVSEVMVPLIDVTAIEQKTPAIDAANFAIGKSYTRFPVYRERVDQIVGIVDTRSLLFHQGPYDTLHIHLRKPVFVPESMPVKSLLHELRHRGEPMAIVVDEYGGAVGIATMEDVLEEILGQIKDEFDPVSPMYRKVGPNRYVFSARAEIQDINERFRFNVPEGEYETLGGYLLELFGRIPRHEEAICSGDLCFTVLDPTATSLTDVRIEVLPSENHEEGDLDPG
jgi:magnesium and cobalt exporter, CNNM family